ncbi:transglutaminase N-terminal domain-containing protein, partial [Methylocystis suflitae]|uniref:transglutaminase N-terminal domain-containing protein n=1 Tax=Methylocystis suflitae TaxID=2951405 RepID=UPI002E1AD197|nr:transglutaminase family protein [Methylocystis suflitae]
MIYDIAHRTIYKYDAPVASARCAMRLIPRNDRGQTLLSSDIELSPPAEILNERIDFHGNRVCEARIHKPHTRL